MFFKKKSPDSESKKQTPPKQLGAERRVLTAEGRRRQMAKKEKKLK